MDPSLDGFAGHRCNLELDGPPGLLLHHHGPRGHLPAMGHIRDPNFDQVAATNGIDRQVKQRQVTDLIA